MPSPATHPDSSAPVPAASAAAGVTYLFSDIEGSTRLWESETERIAPAAAWHDALSRDAVQRHRGAVVKMTGDGIHAAFDDPADAVAAVLEIQLALQSADAVARFGGLTLKVRCGLHFGADQRRDNDFFGRAVNRAARIMQAAHGGQVLLSQAVADRASLRLPAEASLRDLGLVRLRDLASPERLHQLLHPALRADFPALRSLASTPNNLAQQLNSFVGRARELAQVRAQLADPSLRLLTLLGMGGLGKSRLSVQVAAEVLDDFPDGVWFIELAPLSDPRSVPQALASVLGVKEEAGGSVLDALLKHLREKRALVVLDNCEHVVQACAELAKALLQAAPQLKVLTSSRDALQIAGETVVQVAPLAAPAADGAATLESLSGIDAVRLFIDRASAAQPSFRVTEKNAAAVADICRRLDGIPLALELAAARTRALTVEQIAVRLNDRFKLLVTGDRTVLPRQRTLRALVDWSYDLLSAQEKTLFARLSVFAGGWTLDAAEAVGAGGDIDAADVLDLLARLVEKSLVIVDLDGGRYGMLDTVRQYAHERLLEAEGAADTRERHLEFFAAWVELVRPKLMGGEQAEWLARLDLEHENVLLAHAWCGQVPSSGERDLAMASALKYYWMRRGLLDQAHRVTTEALGRPDVAARSPARWRGLADLGSISYFLGRYTEARAHVSEALSIAEQIGDPQRLVVVHQLLGMIERAIGNSEAALRHCEEAVRRARELGDRRTIAITVNTHAQVLRANGDLQRAQPLYSEAVQLLRELGDEENLAAGLLNLAILAIERAEPQVVRPLLREAAALARKTGSKAIGQFVIEGTAGLAALEGRWGLCGELLGAAQVQSERSGLARSPADQAFIDAVARRAQQALGERLDALRERGAALGYGDSLRRAADAVADDA